MLPIGWKACYNTMPSSKRLMSPCILHAAKLRSSLTVPSRVQAYCPMPRWELICIQEPGHQIQQAFMAQPRSSEPVFYFYKKLTRDLYQKSITGQTDKLSVEPFNSWFLPPELRSIEPLPADNLDFTSPQSVDTNKRGTCLLQLGGSDGRIFFKPTGSVKWFTNISIYLIFVFQLDSLVLRESENKLMQAEDTLSTN